MRRRISTKGSKTKKAKMARSPILGAGGIVLRGGGEPLIAVVQRRKDNAWVLPKGKLKSNESAIAAAEREVQEETGQDVAVHEFVGAISYAANRKPKVVQFWRMQADDGAMRKLSKDIRAVKWLPLNSAIKKLRDPLEQVFLRNVAERVLANALPRALEVVSAAEIQQVNVPAELPPDQPTALMLPIVEPSIAPNPSASPSASGRDERMPELRVAPAAETMPKPPVLPAPLPKPVVIATSAPTPRAPAPARSSGSIEPVIAVPVVTNRADVLPIVTKPDGASANGVKLIATRAGAKLATQQTVPVASPPAPLHTPGSVALKPLPTGVATKPITPIQSERRPKHEPAAEPTRLNLLGRFLRWLRIDWSEAKSRRHGSHSNVGDKRRLTQM
jgi:8-oxo-dGTP diphosphatase